VEEKEIRVSLALELGLEVSGDGAGGGKACEQVNQFDNVIVGELR